MLKHFELYSILESAGSSLETSHLEFFFLTLTVQLEANSNNMSHLNISQFYQCNSKKNIVNSFCRLQFED